MGQTSKLALRRAKEARGGGNFLPFRMDVLQSQALADLSPHACKLLLDIASQWRFGHNGDASAAFEKIMRARGWRSKTTLSKALKELCAAGFIILTRQGSLHKCSLYGIGWLAIDGCGGKLDMKATTKPIHDWLAPLKPVKNKLSSPSRVPKPLKKADVGAGGVPDG